MIAVDERLNCEKRLNFEYDIEAVSLHTACLVGVFSCLRGQP